MVWYANEILFEASENAVAFIEDRTELKEHAYLIQNPIQHDWYRAEHEHAAPEQGLIVLRPIGNKTGSHQYNWFKNNAERYNEGAVLEPLALDLVKSASKKYKIGLYEAFSGFSTEELESHYPALVLAGLMSDTIGETVVLYEASSSGGPFDWELAWFFGENERLLKKKSWDDDAQIEVRHGSQTPFKGNILVTALQALGCKQPSHYFAPHTRSFPWAEHKFR